ncbi:ferrous iron transport protein A [Pseudomonas sp. SWRI79]|uniref:Ferrous iron transport protein A n=1 Tax=Pseudomonas farris TaxID=2841207 RepID=A0ABS6PZK1_9PSED|nr:FeoA family protein [Pseudomonas farris]MBV4465892.1 ferrous iron transport protein A [Pseudomonas farris]
MRLCDLPNRQKACVTHVEGSGEIDPLSQRLQDIGFVPGELVTVVARALWGGDPVLIQVGGSRFALRRDEAKMILVEVCLNV